MRRNDGVSGSGCIKAVVPHCGMTCRVLFCRCLGAVDDKNHGIETVPSLLTVGTRFWGCDENVPYQLLQCTNRLV